MGKYGCDLPAYPQVRIHIAMLTTAKGILKKEIVLDPYGKYFPETPTEADSENTDKLNELLSLLIPAMNEGKTPDLAAAAKKTGVDLDAAKDLMQMLQEKFDKMGR